MLTCQGQKVKTAWLAKYTYHVNHRDCISIVLMKSNW